jgi:hypothetical protein
MPSQLAQKMRERNVKAAPVDEETARMIKEIAKVTKDQPSHVIKAAVNILCQAIGRKVILQDEDSNWQLVIDGYSDLEKIYKSDGPK